MMKRSLTQQGDGLFGVPEMTGRRLETIQRLLDPFGSSVIRSQVTDHSGVFQLDGGFWSPEVCRRHRKLDCMKFGGILSARDGWCERTRAGKRWDSPPYSYHP